ncbi:MAG TPA: LamG-like jellyroll fold domain-containing protein [Nocardioidaceae bacterium]|jgi:hypothetical protein|nr:LamG-like jellyroll fold domain-containing protein [Nocardioidaceae bacterium]
MFTLVLVVATLLVPSGAAGTGYEDRVRYTASESRGMSAVDASGYHIDGTLRGGVSRRDGAYKFHPLSKGKHRYDRIRAPHDPALNPRSAPFRFGARVKVSRHAEWSHTEMAVVRHGDTDTAGGDYKLELVKTADGDVSAFCVWHDSDGDGTGYVRGSGPLKTIANGKWHQITCGRVDRNTVSLTIDGHVTRRPVSGDLGALVSTDPLLIGFHFKQDGIRRREQFVGLMDDIHVSVR